jgi:hypothetical protein
MFHGEKKKILQLPLELTHHLHVDEPKERPSFLAIKLLPSTQSQQGGCTIDMLDPWRRGRHIIYLPTIALP